MMKTLKATGDSWEAIFAPEVRLFIAASVVVQRDLSHTPPGSELPNHCHGRHE